MASCDPHIVGIPKSANSIEFLLLQHFPKIQDTINHLVLNQKPYKYGRLLYHKIRGFVP